jgi:hypothetical protein
VYSLPKLLEVKTKTTVFLTSSDSYSLRECLRNDFVSDPDHDDQSQLSCH